MILRPHSTPSLESYGTSSMNSIRAKPMTPRPNFRFDRVGVHVDDIVEHADRRPNRAFEFLPVDVPLSLRVAFHVPLQIDRPEVARLVGQERLFPALSYNETVTYHGVRHRFREVEHRLISHRLLCRKEVRK